DALAGEVKHPSALEFTVVGDGDAAGDSGPALIANGGPLIDPRRLRCPLRQRHELVRHGLLRLFQCSETVDHEGRAVKSPKGRCRGPILKPRKAWGEALKQALADLPRSAHG